VDGESGKSQTLEGKTKGY